MKYSADNRNFYLTAENYLFYRDKIWFSEIDCNELYCYDIQSEKVTLICKFSAEDEYKQRLFGTLLPLEDKLYAVPLAAKKLYEIDILSYEIKEIEIKKPKERKQFKYLEDVKFVSAHSYNRNIYLVGATYPGIIEYDSINGEMTCYDEWVNDVELLRKQNNQNAFFRKTMLVGTTIYAPSCMGNFVLEFNVVTKNHKFYKVGNDKCYFSSICSDGNFFWLAPRGLGPIIKWDCKKNSWKEIGNYPREYNPCEFSYSDIAYFNEDLYCIPMQSSVLIKIHKDSERLVNFTLDDFETSHLSFVIADNRLFLFSQVTGTFVVINSKNIEEQKALVMPQRQNEYHMKYSSRLYQALSENKPIENNELIYEKYQDTLMQYLIYIMQLGNRGEECGNELIIGTKIHDELCH